MPHWKGALLVLLAYLPTTNYLPLPADSFLLTTHYSLLTTTYYLLGSLFVFDRRNTVPLGEGGAEVVGKCRHCAAPTEGFVNCCNVDCNLLHLVCGACFGEREGF